MYRLLFLIVLALPFCISGLSQETDDLYYTPKDNSKIDLKTIPKGTWKIIIRNNSDKETNFQFIGESLVAQNFQIGSLSKDFYTISTVPKAHERLNFNYILNFIAKDSIIIITGTYKINASIDLGMVESSFDNEKIENRGQIGSPIREAFRKMIEFAMNLTALDKMEFVYE